MLALATQFHPNVVSAKVYGLILDSPRLRQKLLPEGLASSPYEILDYRATLVLADPEGRQAVFHRSQEIRFLQDGVSALLDHFWGDGIGLTHYRHSAGPIGDSFKDDGRRHLVIELPRPTRRGETLSFDVERTVAASFTGAREWVETTIDHPIRQLSRAIIFPKERPCRTAELVVQGQVQVLSPVSLPDGRTTVSIFVRDPQANTPYTIYWSW